MGPKLEMVAKGGAGLPGRPASFRLPRPTSSEILLQIIERFEERVSLQSTEPLHLIGVATGGDQIASAVATRFALVCPHTPVWLSSINLMKPLNIVAPLTSVNGQRPRTIVFDNAVTTGHTMHEVLKLLEGKSVTVDLIVKLIDYRDGLETGATQFLELEHHVPIASLFTVDEILPVTDPL